MTKQEAIRSFKAQYLQYIDESDKPALREAWNNYTDDLCKGGYITQKQYDTWIAFQ